MINPLPTVRAEWRRSRAGASAVVVLIGLAVALGVAVTAQERGLRTGSARAADSFDLVVGARGSATQLVLTTVYLQSGLLELVPGSVLTSLQAEPGVAYVAPLVFGDSYAGLPVVGSTADLVTLGGTRPLAQGRVFVSDREVVVGADVPLSLGASFAAVHGSPTLRSEPPGDAAVHSGFDYVVVGRMPRLGSPWDRAIVAPVEALWRVHARPRGHGSDSEDRIGPPWGADVSGVSAIVVKPRSVADAYRLRARYRDERTMAVFPAEVLVELYALVGDARAALSLIALATQTLVVAAVLLTMIAALAERRRSLAVLRALGASRAYVFAAVWVYVSLLVAVGAALGLAVGWCAALGFSTLLRARTGLALPVGLSGHEVAMAGALVIVGAALALIPAGLSYRQPVAAGLKS